MLADAALVVGAYLLGSLPYALLLARAKGLDVSQEEDLHDALWRKVGRPEGLSAALIDVLKGVVPILIGFALGFGLLPIALAGVAAVAGQMWPIFQKFDGERGNTTGLGTVATLTIVYNAWLVLVIALIPVAIGFGIRTVPRFMAPGQTINKRLELGGPPSRGLPLGVGIGFAAAPLASWGLRQSPEMTLALVILFIAIMIRRLTADLRTDLKTATNVKSIVINRLLYDRSYL